jgi:hypothetical protein
MASIINASTSGAGGVITTADASGQLELQTAGVTRQTIDVNGNVGIGTSSPSTLGLTVYKASGSSGSRYSSGSNNFEISINGVDAYVANNANGPLQFWTNGSERMRIDSSGNVTVPTSGAYLFVGSSTYTGDAASGAGGGFGNSANSGVCWASVAASSAAIFNRQSDDGTVVLIRQAGNTEGTIAVSGTTVSYNGGHLSRWSQWQNESGQPEVYRGTVLESVDAMCEWYKDGELLPNEQATKTIVSTTPASKAVAGVFDMYDHDDEDNPYDFYVAQSGDFVIRLAAGTVVQNGDLLESAGDGTARVQADDICRSSTIAKVTSNYVSETYADGSFCVPCILMIG